MVGARRLAEIAASGILPGAPQILRGRINLSSCLMFVVGLASLINLFIGFSFVHSRHIETFDPFAASMYFGLFQSAFPGRLAQRDDAPGTICVVAEVRPDKVTFERQVPIYDPSTPFPLDRHFWAFFALYVLLYLACSVLSLWSCIRECGRDGP